ncbi:acyltransferase family protein [Rubeoparvulum massiliense]|uniref:acyltransferase family protein n=1 Tax=Rubeoparvulum massiliense TaxID=1631346 RepID=UPI00065DE7B6|nr:acyltransferase family protein [Rubeoparvulum massiliense]
MNKPASTFLPEINLIRGMACVSVVVMHSVTSQNYAMGLPAVQKLFLFATPVFLFISAFLMFYRYPDTIPSYFMKRRVQYILIPYLIWSITYSYLITWTYQHRLPTAWEVTKNALTGQYHIYFILIIFQYFLLFMLLHKLKWQYAMGKHWVLIVTFIFNLLYLAFFTFIEPDTFARLWTEYFGTQLSTPLLYSMWGRYYFILFPAWIFYFVLAGYLAYNYDRWKAFVLKYKWWIFLLLVIAGYLVVVSIQHGRITSKRPEVYLYTMVVLAAMFIISNWIQNNWIGRSFHWIARYSFGIYLAHPMLYTIFHFYYKGVHPYLYFTYSFVIQLGGALLLTLVLSKLPFGKFIVGKLQKKLPKHANTSTNAAQM